jgi:type IV secretory pathway VirB2 component (pilin)
MKPLMALASTSLADPLASSPLTDAVAWLQGTVLGTVATAIAVIAIAVIGMLMLTGRLNVKRGATTILGCFILFGAPSIARGILDAAARLSQSQRTPEPARALPTPRPIPTATTAYDPYAGASLQPR